LETDWTEGGDGKSGWKDLKEIKI